MPFLLTRVPLIAVERVVAHADVPVTLRVNQPVVWIRLAAWNQRPLLAAVAFPAIIDSGNNDSFLIPGSLFRGWTGLTLDAMHPLRTIEVNGLTLGCYGFNLQLFRLSRGNPTDHVVRHLETDRGITIIPDGLDHRFPRMPVVGVRCLRLNRLTFSINGNRGTFSLWSPPLPPRPNR
jgi:hypothetical protein